MGGVEEQPTTVSSTSAVNIHPEGDGNKSDPPHLGFFQFLYPISLLKRHENRRHQLVPSFLLKKASDALGLSFLTAVNGTV